MNQEARPRARRRGLIVAVTSALALLVATTSVAARWDDAGGPGQGATARRDEAGEAPCPSSREASPLAKLDAPTADAPREGTVAERIGAGPYTYLRVTSAAAPDAWIATLGEGAHVGARVAIRSFGTRRDFASKRLGRTFARLNFALVTVMEDEEDDR